VTRDELVRALTGTIGKQLATDLVRDFLVIRQDALTGTLERGNAGKFVETVVQALQYIERKGKFDVKPSVDDYLSKLADRTAPPLDDGLRIVASRVGRAMYTLRNKRNIAHKGSVDPNTYDLNFLHHSAQWTMAEFLRQASGLSMEEAGRLIDLVQVPVGGLVEDLGGRKLVLHDTSTGHEALILLHNIYPGEASLEQLTNWMDRRSADTVRKALKSMWDEKLVDGNTSGYRLTGKGHDAATAAIRQLVGAQRNKER